MSEADSSAQKSQHNIAALRAAGIDDPVREWRILTRNFSGSALDEALQQRLKRVPMSQILGYRDFWKDRFFVNADVLDPRPESELFIELSLQSGRKFARILDLGTGSGALGLSALREFPAAKAVLVDDCERALQMARKNAKALGLEDKVHILRSNWLEAVDGRFNLILCNPPYLSANELENAQAELHFEPESALSDKRDGLTHYRSIAPILADFLEPEGIALFEHGANQQDAVAQIFSDEGFLVKKFDDLGKNPRIVMVFLQKIQKT